MIKRLFHAWEHRLASVTKNRVERAFEWGLDWLPPSVESNLGDVERVEQWSAGVMRDTQAFFTPPPTSQFELVPASAERQSRGEAGTLRFPSALTTPSVENNTVSARWFPTAAARDGDTRGPVVVVLPQWNADAGGHVGLSQLLARCGISALRLSLPYHDVRMPPELTRADYIVSANVVRTVQACRQAVLDTRRAIDWLSSQGFERIGILGTSLGSCLSMLTTAHDTRIRAAALNHVSPWFADVVWTGLSTRHVRAGIDGHIDLERLRKIWLPISPMSYLDRMRHAQTLLVYARYDLTFPVDLSRQLVDAFRAHELPFQTSVLPCGHYSTGMTPFKYLDAYLLIRFLRRHL